MRNVTLLLALGVIGAGVTACTGDTGYYGSSYPYPTTANNRGYYSNGVYYTSNTAYAGNGYTYRPSRRGPNGDYDGDGIPNRYDRDANGDGIPDRWQR